MLRLGAAVFQRTATAGAREACIISHSTASALAKARGLLTRDYVTKMLLPALSPTMTEGNLVKWLIKEGDKFSTGDVIYEMETDKATMEVEAADDGVLAKILVPAGSGPKPVNTPVALVAEEGEDISNVQVPDDAAAPAPAKAAPTPAAPPAASAPAPAAAAPSATATTKPLLPSVKQLLEHHHLDANSIPASGPRGHLLKGDVLTFIATGGKAAPAPTAAAAAAAPQATAPTPSAPAPSTPTPAPAVGNNPYVDIELTNMRKIIAKRLTESKQQIPHSYASVEVNLDEIETLRKVFKDSGKKVSVNDFIVRASARALKDVPEVNSQLAGGSIKRNETIDVSVAVATPSGLITPIVPRADGLSVLDISNTIKELAGRAKENKLKPHEFQGGSFSISNLGMFGISEFFAVINPPQAAIMAVGAGRQVPVPVDGGEGDEVAYKISTLMTAKISYDERVVDPEAMGRFLEAFKSYTEKPMTMV
eukprot:comp23220_c1_seq1/m.37830 comp23220_c1_seq1/g.37830  ORF comp23220_c1_seq1/g.37830 comp23220_c1_seq1/m.37830 type:complete len:480 (-) comp23220_c1_seq1:434-1873(-)